ncbi:Aldo keto reductase [Schizopora paradoxa]|uniref:Aldo keto reductase n=1 Tax=Schizopora paradoxa TaxID=27342 RepID=A0A0H2S0P2_9AGAM|nr:Aldo keto reductase [Schizopora paradoxa]
MTDKDTRQIAGQTINPIGFGAMSLGGRAYTGSALATDEDRLKLLDAVFESGCNFWDTADIYSDSEEIIGKWLQRTGKRSSIFLASKFGCRLIFEESRLTGMRIDGSPEYVKEAVESSLKRLGVDSIDLYYLHRPDSNTPIETTVKALAEFVKAGKIKHLGLSECSAATVRRAHAVHPITAVQVEYSPFTLDIEFPEIGLLETCRELGIKIVAYSPLGRGILAGQIKSADDFGETDFRKHVPKYSKENFPKILDLVDTLKKIGAQYGATSGQVAIAWLLAQGDDIIPIPGTSKTKYLEENMGALKVKLTANDLEEIRKKAESAETLRAQRYPPGMQEQLFAETPAL